jgi:hypothetical protein
MRASVGRLGAGLGLGTDGGGLGTAGGGLGLGRGGAGLGLESGLYSATHVTDWPAPTTTVGEAMLMRAPVTAS